MSSSRTYMAAALAALAGILLFVLVMPAWDGVSARRAALDERQQILSDRTAILAKISNLKQEAATRAGEIKQFANVVPATKSAPDLVLMIQTIASQNGLQLTTLAMGSNTDTEKVAYAAQAIDLGL